MAFLIVSGSPRLVHHVGVEVLDEAEAIAAQFQAVGAHAHAVFADVEGVLAVLRRGRVAVGHDHLRERGAIENRALLAAIVVPQVVQRQPFAGVEADDEAPVLPLHPIAIDREARPLGLRDVERLDVGALVRHAVGGVVRPVAAAAASGRIPRRESPSSALRSTTGRSPSIGRT